MGATQWMRLEMYCRRWWRRLAEAQNWASRGDLSDFHCGAAGVSSSQTADLQGNLPQSLHRVNGKRQ